MDRAVTTQVALICAHSCVIISVLIAWLFAPLLWHTPERVELDDIATWSGNGPAASVLPPNYKGVWYASENQEAAPCDDEIKHNKTLCAKGGFKRSPLVLLDTSYCSYSGLEEPFVCNVVHSGLFATWSRMGPSTMIVSRAGYRVERDEEFKRRPVHLFEGGMHLSMLGLSFSTWAKLTGGSPYRVTAYDMKGDGSRILRLTWWGADGNTPQPRKTADKAWTYTMKRVVDGHGRVDKAVVREIKQIHGPTLWKISSLF